MKRIDMKFLFVDDCFNMLSTYFNTIFFSYISAPTENNSQQLTRNEYRLPTAPSSQASSSRLVQRRLPSLPVESDNRQAAAFSFSNREPPPPYWAPYRNQSSQLEPQRPPHPRRPAPAPPTRSQANQIAIRSKVEQFRNRIVSDTDSDDDRRRPRVLSPRGNPNAFRNEVLLSK